MEYIIRRHRAKLVTSDVYQYDYAVYEPDTNGRHRLTTRINGRLYGELTSLTPPPDLASLKSLSIERIDLIMEWYNSLNALAVALIRATYPETRGFETDEADHIWAMGAYGPTIDFLVIGPSPLDHAAPSGWLGRDWLSHGCSNALRYLEYK